MHRVSPSRYLPVGLSNNSKLLLRLEKPTSGHVYLDGKDIHAIGGDDLRRYRTQVQAVVQQRCVMCHNAQVQQKNVALHTPELIRQHAQAMYQQAVMLKAMPLNNATQITDEERALLKRWFEAGAR